MKILMYLATLSGSKLRSVGYSCRGVGGVEPNG